MPSDSSGGDTDPLDALVARLSETPESDASDELASVFRGNHSTETVVYRLESVLDDPETVRGVAQSLGPLLGSDDETLRNGAVQLLSYLGEDDPEVAEPVLDDLLALLGDESQFVRWDAVRAVSAVADEYSGAVAARADDLIGLLDASSPEIRATALSALEAAAPKLADGDPQRVTRAVVDAVKDHRADADETVTGPVLGDTATDHTQQAGQRGLDFGDDDTETGRAAGATLAALATRHPDDVGGVLASHGPVLSPTDSAVVIEPVVDALIGVLDADATVGAAAERAERLTAVLARCEFHDELRGKAAQALALLAENDASAVADAVVSERAAVVDLADADDAFARGAVMGLSTYVTEHYPDEFDREELSLDARLDDANPGVRASAVWVLRYLGGRTDRERVERIAESDPNPEVRRVAAEVADTIE